MRGIDRVSRSNLVQEKGLFYYRVIRESSERKQSSVRRRGSDYFRSKSRLFGSCSSSWKSVLGCWFANINWRT